MLTLCDTIPGDQMWSFMKSRQVLYQLSNIPALYRQLLTYIISSTRHLIPSVVLNHWCTRMWNCIPYLFLFKIHFYYFIMSMAVWPVCLSVVDCVNYINWDGKNHSVWVVLIPSQGMLKCVILEKEIECKQACLYSLFSVSDHRYNVTSSLRLQLLWLPTVADCLCASNFFFKSTWQNIESSVKRETSTEKVFPAD